VEGRPAEREPRGRRNRGGSRSRERVRCGFTVRTQDTQSRADKRYPRGHLAGEVVDLAALVHGLRGYFEWRTAPVPLSRNRRIFAHSREERHGHQPAGASSSWGRSSMVPPCSRCAVQSPVGAFGRVHGDRFRGEHDVLLYARDLLHITGSESSSASSNMVVRVAGTTAAGSSAKPSSRSARSSEGVSHASGRRPRREGGTNPRSSPGPTWIGVAIGNKSIRGARDGRAMHRRLVEAKRPEAELRRWGCRARRSARPDGHRRDGTLPCARDGPGGRVRPDEADPTGTGRREYRSHQDHRRTRASSPEERTAVILSTHHVPREPKRGPGR